MSWDIFVQDLPDGVSSAEEIPDGFRPAVLGAREDLIHRIRSVLPEVDFSDPAWGVLEREGASIEFNMGKEGASTGFALHVRGGPQAAFVVRLLLDALRLRALDPSSETGFFALDDGSTEGFEAWRKFRDAALGQGPG